MEEILNEKIREWAKEETRYQIAVAIFAVLFIISFMSKQFKGLIEALPSIRKALAWTQRKWFSDAERWRELLSTIAQIQNDVAHVKHEVQYNGNSSMKDAVKRTEAAVSELKTLVQHNKALRDISDLCSDRMLFKVDTVGKCTFINDAFLKAFGYQESDVINFGFEDLVHDEDRDEMRKKWEKAIKTSTSFRDEQRVRDYAGTWHRCLVRGFPVHTDGILREFSGTIEVL